MAGSNLGTMTAPCPRCGTTTAAGDPYCKQCGLPLNALGDQSTRSATGEQFPPPPAPSPWATASQSQPAAPLFPGTGPNYTSGSQPGDIPIPPPPPPAWQPGSQPYPPAINAPFGKLPTLSGPPPAWQTGNTPYPPVAQPGRFTAPPPGVSSAPPARSRRPIIIVGIVVALLAILGASGAAAYILTRPKPVLTITGPAKSGANPAGEPDTAFHVVGMDFSSNSLITFYRDGQSLPGAPNIESDGSGNFTTDLHITDDWPLGPHTLTARDARAYEPQNPVTVVVLSAPLLTISSQYQQGSTPAGTQGTTFTVSGKRFAPTSPVTLLLDGAPIAGQPPITSDAHGGFQGQVVVGSWAKGSHTITARDAQGNVTKGGATLVIVAAGVAGTPGPNGAPADNATFDLPVSVSAKDSTGKDASFQQVLSVTGRPDPAGGSVCDAKYDNGQPQTFSYTTGGVSYTETITFSCSGTYKSGHLTYTETANSDKIVGSDGSKCAAQGAYVYGQFDGTFTNSTTISGTYHSDRFFAPCQSGPFTSLFRNSAQGTWTGAA